MGPGTPSNKNLRRIHLRIYCGSGPLKKPTGNLLNHITSLGVRLSKIFWRKFLTEPNPFIWGCGLVNCRFSGEIFLNYTLSKPSLPKQTTINDSPRATVYAMAATCASARDGHVWPTLNSWYVVEDAMIRDDWRTGWMTLSL